LRTHLLTEIGNKDQNTFLITSSIRGEGKTTTACNLAIILANSRPVLLIDADLRAPSVHKMFGLSVNSGLGEYLKGELEEEFLFRQSGVDELTIIPAGGEREDSSDILASPKMRNFLYKEKIKEKNRFIIIDSPPVLPVTDSRIISQYVDQILFIAEAGRTPKETISYALSLLSGANLLGVILNNISTFSSYYPYSYYGDEYRSYGKREEEGNE
jgi:capsular exopolysaccharide synthesis family protein